MEQKTQYSSMAYCTKFLKKEKKKGKKTTHTLAYSKIRCQGLHSLESKIIYPTILSKDIPKLMVSEII